MNSLTRRDIPCIYCSNSSGDMDLDLLLGGPRQTALKRKIPIYAAKPGGFLYRHWVHLQIQMLEGWDVPEVPPPDDEDPVEKTRWVQRNLFKAIFSADRAFKDPQGPTPNPLTTLAQQKNKGSFINSLISSIRLEAELSGGYEKTKIKAKRAAEREIAEEESQLGEVLSKEAMTRLHIHDLREEGYEVRKIVPESKEEVIDVSPSSTPKDPTEDSSSSTNP